MSIENIRFIAYDINTAPKDPVFKNYQMPSGTYLGLDDASQDIEARCQLMQRAMSTAAAQIAVASPLDDDNTLNVFMAPEFFFRGSKGAYQMDEVSYAISCLQQLASAPEWDNWVFVFGSFVAVAGSNGGNDEAYNFTLMQQGGTDAQGDSGARVVMKELKSDIDFISTHANPGGVLLGDVEYIDAGDSSPGRERQQVNYDGAGIFELAGITWAVEVCLDHGEERLQRSPQLPGEAEVQLQLIPSCGMEVKEDAVIVTLDGLVFNCDGGGFGNTVNKLILDGSPPSLELDPVPALPAVAVDDTNIDLPLSPPLSVAIDQLYADGAGKVVLYPLQDCPPQRTISGTTHMMQWQPEDGVSFTFLLNYDEDGDFSALLCRIKMNSLDFHDHDYFMPMQLDTLDHDKGPVKIMMKQVPGSNGYDAGLWCKIDVTGFKFEGVAFEYYDDKIKGDPETIW